MTGSLVAITVCDHPLALQICWPVTSGNPEEPANQLQGTWQQLIPRQWQGPPAGVRSDRRWMKPSVRPRCSELDRCLFFTLNFSLGSARLVPTCWRGFNRRWWICSGCYSWTICPTGWQTCPCSRTLIWRITSCQSWLWGNSQVSDAKFKGMKVELFSRARCLQCQTKLCRNIQSAVSLSFWPNITWTLLRSPQPGVCHRLKGRQTATCAQTSSHNMLEFRGFCLVGC